MNTPEETFWTYFKDAQLDIIVAYKSKNHQLLNKYIEIMHTKLSEVNKKIFFTLRFNQDTKNVLIFSINGKNKLKSIAYDLIETAPFLENWKYKIDVKPHNKKKEPLKLFFCEHNMIVSSDQVYVHVHKIYKTSNKLHLYIYFDLNKTGIPKAELNPLAQNMLFYYLGDNYFYNHISKVKIVRRRLNRINFFPLNELKNLIEFKSPS